jgi:adenylate cyclase
MGKEIERKFIVTNDSWQESVKKKSIFSQGYISHSGNCTVRIRISEDNAWLTVKGDADNITRSEFEYNIPKDDAARMLEEFASDNMVHKTRYFIIFAGMEWTVDVFHGENSNLTLAEVELTEENIELSIPAWAGKEVSTDIRYTNAYLAQNPFNHWE